MTATITTAPRESRTTLRDDGIDLVRAGCLVVVVALHAMMVGVSVGADGPVFENAIDTAPWFTPVSWAVQVMPLFFIIGGFSSMTALRRARSRGTTASAFVAARLYRLLVPSLASIAVIAAGLGVLGLCGLRSGLVETAGFRISQPLWFLGVYVMCQTLVPLLARAHEWRPVLTLVGLATVAIAVDVARVTTGVDAIGLINLLVVWVLIQQLGFWLADERITTFSVPVRLAWAASALATLLGLSTLGPTRPTCTSTSIHRPCVLPYSVLPS